MNIRLRIFIALSLLPVSAFAYVDPGSGMVIWQGILAIVGGVIVCVRNPRQAIKRLVERFRKKQ